MELTKSEVIDAAGRSQDQIFRDEDACPQVDYLVVDSKCDVSNRFMKFLDCFFPYPSRALKIEKESRLLARDFNEVCLDFVSWLHDVDYIPTT